MQEGGFGEGTPTPPSPIPLPIPLATPPSSPIPLPLLSLPSPPPSSPQTLHYHLYHHRHYTTTSTTTTTPTTTFTTITTTSCPDFHLISCFQPHIFPCHLHFSQHQLSLPCLASLTFLFPFLSTFPPFLVLSSILTTLSPLPLSILYASDERK